MQLWQRIRPRLFQSAHWLAVMAAFLVASMSSYGAAEAGSESCSPAAAKEALLDSVLRFHRLSERGRAVASLSLPSEILPAETARQQSAWTVRSVVGHRLSNGLMAPLRC
jgi:hypothetical protein